MRTRPTRQVAAAVVLLMILLAGCGGSGREKGGGPPAGAPPEGTGFPVTVTDRLNRTVTVPKVPAKIVSLAPAHTEILFALGLGEKVAGVTDYCDYPPQAKEKPKIGGFDNPSAELVINARPDLVLAGTLHEKIVKQLEGAGIPAVVLEAQDIRGVMEVIETVGRITGTPDKAKEICAELAQRRQKVAEKVAGLPEKDRPRVYFELWSDPLTTAGRGSFLDSLIEAAGGKNVAGDLNQEWVIYNPEALLAKDPQVIIYTHHFTSGQTLEAIKSRKGWAGLAAVKNNRLYQFPDENLVVRPGPRIIEGLELLAQMLHPELFQDRPGKD